MSRFKLHLWQPVVTIPPTALNMGMNLAATGWTTWYHTDRFAGAGEWSSDAAGGGDLPAANLDSDRWAKSMPSGSTYVTHAITGRALNTTKYVITWTGNFPQPTNLWQYSIDSWDNTAKTALITPTNTIGDGQFPPALRYAISGTDTTNGTYPKNIVVKPQGDTSTFDATILPRVQAVAVGGPLRMMKMTGVELNGGAPFAGVWGGGTQAAPHYKITMANRTTFANGEWQFNQGTTGSPINSGFPVEAGVQIANAYNRDLWWNIDWNTDQAKTEYDINYIRDNLNGNLKAYIEIANEVWNYGYYVATQANDEALGTNRTSGVSLTPCIGQVGGARYIEKVIQYMGWVSARWAVARTDGLPKATLKRVGAWQHAAFTGAGGAAAMLDYIPDGGSTAFKASIDCFSTAIYPSPYTIDNTMNSTYDAARGYLPIIDAYYKDTENLCRNAAYIRASCDARGLEYNLYEFGPESYLGASNDALARTLHYSAEMGTWLQWFLQRLEAATPNMVTVYYAFQGSVSAQYGTWNLIEQMYQDPAGSPKYQAMLRYLAGQRSLVALYGTLIAPVGATVGTVIGYIHRRLIGSTVSLSSGFGFVDSTATVLAVKVTDASLFTGATTLSPVITETGPSTSLSTTLSCLVTADCVWSPGRSPADIDISANGLTIRRLTTGGGDVDAFGSIARTNGYFENDVTLENGSMHIALAWSSLSGGPGFDAHSASWWKNGALFVNGSNVVSWPSWTTGDTIDLYLSASGKLYGRKGAQWYGAAGTLTNAQVNSDTGGYDITAMVSGSGGLYPVCDMTNAGSVITSRFKDAAFTRTKPTGASAWV